MSTTVSFSGETKTPIQQALTLSPEERQQINEAQRQLNVYDVMAASMKEGQQKEQFIRDTNKARANLYYEIGKHQMGKVKNVVFNTARLNNFKNQEQTFLIGSKNYTSSQLRDEGWDITREGDTITASPNPLNIGKTIEQDLLSLGWSRESIARVATYQGFKTEGLDYYKSFIADEQLYKSYLTGKEEGKWSTPEQFADQYVNIEIPFLTPTKSEVSNKIKQYNNMSPSGDAYYKALHSWAQEQQYEPAGTTGNRSVLKEGFSFLQSKGGMEALSPSIAMGLGTGLGIMSGSIRAVYPLGAKFFNVGVLTYGTHSLISPSLSSSGSSSEKIGNIGSRLIMYGGFGTTGFIQGSRFGSSIVSKQMMARNIKPITFGEITYNKLNPRNLLVRLSAEKIPEEKVFDYDVLKEKNIFAESPSVKVSLEEFEKVREPPYRMEWDTIGKTEYNLSGYKVEPSITPSISYDYSYTYSGKRMIPVSHTTKGSFEGNVIGKGTSEHPGLFVTPEGRASPHFLGLSSSSSPKYSVSLFPKIKSPSVIGFRVSDVIRAPKGVRHSMSKYNKWIEGLSPSDIASITAKHELGAPEIEALIRYGTEFKLPDKSSWSFIQKIKGYTEYTTYKGRNLPIRRFDIINDSLLNTTTNKDTKILTEKVMEKYTYEPNTYYTSYTSPSSIGSVFISYPRYQQPSYGKSIVSSSKKYTPYMGTSISSYQHIPSYSTKSLFSSYIPSSKYYPSSTIPSKYYPSSTIPSSKYYPSSSLSYPGSSKSFSLSIIPIKKWLPKPPYVQPKTVRPIKKKKKKSKAYRQRKFKQFEPKILGE